MTELSTDLREQVADAAANEMMHWHATDRKPEGDYGLPEAVADAVLVVFEDHKRNIQDRQDERLRNTVAALRYRIEALHELYDSSYHDESAHGALDRAHQPTV